MSTPDDNSLAPLYKAHEQLEGGILLASQEVKVAQENLLAFKKADQFIVSFINDYSANTPPPEATSICPKYFKNGSNLVN